MNKHLLILGMAVLLLAGGLSGCLETPTIENPIEQGNVDFKIEEVTVTSELEMEKSWTNETEMIVFNDSKLVIISILMENKEEDWLEVSSFPTSLFDEEGFGGLIDDEGNVYWSKPFVEFNDTYYSVPMDDEEDFGISVEMPPNTTALKTIVFQIPLNREPETLRLSYGFKANELTNVKDWFETEIDIPS